MSNTDTELFELPPVLDAACGGRMFWFDKQNPNALFIDKRTLEPTQLSNGQTFSVSPDRVMDFRNMSFADNSFHLVVFDPPHLLRAGETSYMAKKYGKLDERWRGDLSAGFKECFRVLKPNGTLIFKWNEYHIALKEILALSPYKPLFGHPSGKSQKTHWVCFMKLDNLINQGIDLKEK